MFAANDLVASMIDPKKGRNYFNRRKVELTSKYKDMFVNNWFFVAPIQKIRKPSTK